MRSFTFQETEPALSFPPKASPPGSPTYSQKGKAVWEDTSAYAEHSDSNLTFSTVCEFWAITSKWTTLYYGGEKTAPHDISLDFAKSIFQQLIRWSDDINTIQARGVQSSHSSIIFQLRRTFPIQTQTNYTNRRRAACGFTHQLSSFSVPSPLPTSNQHPRWTATLRGIYWQHL